MDLEYIKDPTTIPEAGKFTHVIPAQPGTQLLHPVGSAKSPYVVKPAVIAWGVTERGSLIPLTVVGIDEVYHAILTPDGQVDTHDKTYPSYEEWYRETIVSNVKPIARRR